MIEPCEVPPTQASRSASPRAPADSPVASSSASERDFDPRPLGCLCDTCPLRDRIAVPPEIRPGSRILVGEAPGTDEESEGQPFVGRSGVELEKTLRLLGLRRAGFSVTNVLLCRPPGGNLKRYLEKVSRGNRTLRKELKARGVAAGEIRAAEVPSPIDCCRPRLLREVAASSGALLLGGAAFSAVAGERSGEAGMMRSRGYPLEVDVVDGEGEVLREKLPVVATVHPAFVLRTRKWTMVFRSDLAKFLRHTEGRLQWSAPDAVFDPSVGELDAILDRLSEESVVAVDTETDGKEPEQAGLRCVGIGTDQIGVAIGLRSVERQDRIWRCPPSIATERVRNFFARAKRLAGHNVNVFDRPLLDRHGMPLPDFRCVADTVIASHVVEAELPHDLGFLSSWLTDSPLWKPPRGAHSWSTDRELHVYCIQDVANTHRLVGRLLPSVIEDGLSRVYRSDVELQRLCVGMHRAGMQIDEAERRRHALRLFRKLEALREEAVAVTGRSKLNLNSTRQVGRLLYDEWGLPALTMTDAGSPSTKKDAVYELLLLALPDAQVRFLELLVDYRAAARTLAKDVLKIGEVTDWLIGAAALDEGADEGGDDEEEEGRKSGLRVWSDGRVHPFWHGHSVVTGRLSCSDPQVMNVPGTKIDPDSIRSMYVARPGCVLVGCDKSAAEFRMVAVITGDDTWLDLFARSDAGEIDPETGEPINMHRRNAADYFARPVAEITKPERDVGKNFTFGSFYMGEPPTLLAQIRRVRLPDGSRPYARMTLREAEVTHSRLLKAHPALKAYWHRIEQIYRAAGEIRTPILGRRRRFLDAKGGAIQKSLREMVNFPIQGGIADLMSGELICGDAMREIGFEKRDGLGDVGDGMGGAGIIHHGHDSLTVEVAESRAEEVATVLSRIMTRRVNFESRSILIPAEAKIGKKWSET